MKKMCIGKCYVLNEYKNLEIPLSTLKRMFIVFLIKSSLSLQKHKDVFSEFSKSLMATQKYLNS